MTNNKACSFFGHRKIEITEEQIGQLRKLIKDLIEKQEVNTFYFGGFGEFDDLCHMVVTELKSKYPYINRIFCLSDQRHLRILKRPKWLKANDYEEFLYLDLSFDWWYQRIYFRNQEIINRSEFVVFFVTRKENSGAYKAMKYALRKNKNLINIYN